MTKKRTISRKSYEIQTIYATMNANRKVAMHVLITFKRPEDTQYIVAFLALRSQKFVPHSKV